MTKSTFDKSFTSKTPEQVFSRRIDVNKQAQRIQGNSYAGSTFNSGGGHKPYEHNKRWAQNHDTQDNFLGQMLREGTVVDILMKNDSIRSGSIESYDNWSILINYDGQKSLLFKSGVMAITPNYNQRAPKKDYQHNHLSDYNSDYLL